jgi:hypothetical protein
MVYSGGFQRAGELILVFCFVVIALCFWDLGLGMDAGKIHTWDVVLVLQKMRRLEDGMLVRLQDWNIGGKSSIGLLLGIVLGGFECWGTLENRMGVHFMYL